MGGMDESRCAIGAAVDGSGRRRQAMRATVYASLLLGLAAGCGDPAGPDTDGNPMVDAARPTPDAGAPPLDGSAGSDASVADAAMAQDLGPEVPDASDAPTGRVIFEDGFESGDLNGAVGGSWYGGTRRTVTDEAARTGSHALRFEYVGDEDPGADAFSEIRATFSGSDAPEIWLEWYLFVPENYAHRDDPGGPDNNKFVIVGYDDKLHGRWQEPGGWTTRMEINPDPAEGALSRGRIVYGNEDTGVSANFDLEDSRPSGVIHEEDLGRWVRYGYHVRLADSIAARNGEVSLYKDGVLFAHNRNVPLAGFESATPINCFELMGWANSGFTETTVFYIDDVRVYDTDPTW